MLNASSQVYLTSVHPSAEAMDTPFSSRYLYETRRPASSRVFDTEAVPLSKSIVGEPVDVRQSSPVVSPNESRVVRRTVQPSSSGTTWSSASRHVASCTNPAASYFSAIVAQPAIIRLPERATAVLRPPRMVVVVVSTSCESYRRTTTAPLAVRSTVLCEAMRPEGRT